MRRYDHRHGWVITCQADGPETVWIVASRGDGQLEHAFTLTHAQALALARDVIDVTGLDFSTVAEAFRKASEIGDIAEALRKVGGNEQHH